MRANYLNSTEHRIELSIGTLPGVPWTRYDSDPGQVIEGSAAPAYKEKFLRAGYTVATDDEVELAKMVAEDAAKAAAAPAFAAPVAPIVPAVVVPEPPAPPPPPVVASEPVAPPTAAPAPQKGRRGSERGTKG